MSRLPVSAFVLFVAVVFLSLFFPNPTYAQSPDAVGVRAQGMSGAFTAVADDATASWWNPAGLAAGALLNVILEYGELKNPPLPDTPAHGGFSVAFPALGFSYYRMTVSEIQPSDTTAGSTAGRQDTGVPSARSLELSQFGATVGQSAGRHLVVASTLKVMSAGGDTEAGLDMGAMAIYGLFRAGLTVRNVREATFGEGAEAITLRRQVRAGAAVSSATSTAFGGATFAVDADLRSIPTVTGDERRIAAGGELCTKQRWLGGRGGVSVSTIGEKRTAFSGGVSVSVKRGFFVDAQLTGGSDESRKGWSGALRVTF